VLVLKVVDVIEEEVLPLSAGLDDLEPGVELELLLEVRPGRMAVDRVLPQ
jgi:hypothetical protein